MNYKRLKSLSIGTCLPLALLAGASSWQAHGQDPGRLEKLEQENAALKKRLEALEALAAKEGTLATPQSKTLKFLGESELSGFVTGSYFYDMSRPADGVSNGYLWTRNDNSLTLNKIKITLQNLAERSGTDWDVGYSVSMIYGNDAPIVNTGGAAQGWEDVRQAFIDINVPIGDGLNVRAGQLISLLNYESGDGGASNPNFSQGNQWFFTGNGPATGVQLGYAFNEQWDLKARVQNGIYSGVVDNNQGKTAMASLGFKPDDKTWFSLIGAVGSESVAGNNSTMYVGSLLAQRKLTDKYNLTLATELDYFKIEDNKPALSIGGWLFADFTEKFGAAVRMDYVKDNDGFWTSGLLGFPGNGGQDITSLTFTLNYKPVPSLKVQPEIRYDHSSLGGAYDGAKSRWIAGVGLSYLF